MIQLYAAYVPLKIFLAIIFCILTACASNPAANHFKQKGQASYYADSLQGNHTANGEIFKQNALTAAHRKLPFGTKVKVTNLDNGKSVVVRINDRGPFVRGRIIDLSKTAFKKIADTRTGVIKVQVETF